MSMEDIFVNNQLIENGWERQQQVEVISTEAPKLKDWNWVFWLCPYCWWVKFYCDHFKKNV